MQHGNRNLLSALSRHFGVRGRLLELAEDVTMSLIPTGMPSMDDRVAPAFQRAVDASAAARAAAIFQVTKAPTASSCAAMTSRQRSRKARGESLPLTNAPVWET